METIPSTINPRSTEPILHQVLKIALDDEFHAYEAYISVIEKFGAQTPFTNIVEAEQRHQKALIALFETYEVPMIENRWVGAVQVPQSLEEAYMMGVNAEVANIQMYDTLLAYTGNYPDVQDVFYRLQAASYNNHLPAFQSHLNPNVQMPSPEHANQNLDGMIEQMNELSALAGKFSNGQMAQEDILKLLSGPNASFLVGALIGVVGASVLGKMTNNEDKNESTKE